MENFLCNFDLAVDVRRQLDLVASIGSRTVNERLSLKVPVTAIENIRKTLAKIGLNEICHGSCYIRERPRHHDCSRLLHPITVVEATVGPIESRDLPHTSGESVQ